MYLLEVHTKKTLSCVLVHFKGNNESTDGGLIDVGKSPAENLA